MSFPLVFIVELENDRNDNAFLAFSMIVTARTQKRPCCSCLFMKKKVLKTNRHEYAYLICFMTCIKKQKRLWFPCVLCNVLNNDKKDYDFIVCYEHDENQKDTRLCCSCLLFK